MKPYETRWGSLWTSQMARKESFCMHPREPISISGSACHTSEAQIANNFCKNCQILLLFEKQCTLQILFQWNFQKRGAFIDSTVDTEWTSSSMWMAHSQKFIFFHSHTIWIPVTTTHCRRLQTYLQAHLQPQRAAQLSPYPGNCFCLLPLFWCGREGVHKKQPSGKRLMPT